MIPLRAMVRASKSGRENTKSRQLGEYAHFLRSQRLAQGRSLERTAKSLAVSKEALQMLENWESNRLPKGPYVVGLLNAYAELLGVPAIRTRRRTMVHLNRSLFSAESKQTLIVSRLVLVAFAVICALLVAGYLLSTSLSLVAKPELTVFEPSENVLTNNGKITVVGRTGRETAVRVNGVPVVVEEDGAFKYDVYIRQGQNNLEISAVNTIGREHKVIRRVYRSKLLD